MEVDKVPPIEVTDKIARACKLDPSHLTVILTPTSSLAGGMQVVARVLEVALHKAHALHFPLENIIDGTGCAPGTAAAPQFHQGHGPHQRRHSVRRTGRISSSKAATKPPKRWPTNCPSSVSRDYGKPFAEVFKEYKYDFFKVDAMLFSPASVIVTTVDSGRSFHAGEVDEELLERSFEGIMGALRSLPMTPAGMERA